MIFQENFFVHSNFNVADLNPFDVGDDLSDSRMNSFEEGKHDKDYGVPNVPTRPITQSKAKKIQQAFILHLQDWISSVQPLFHMLEADSSKERPFKALKVNICTVEVADQIVIVGLRGRLLIYNLFNSYK